MVIELWQFNVLACSVLLLSLVVLHLYLALRSISTLLTKKPEDKVVKEYIFPTYFSSPRNKNLNANQTEHKRAYAIYSKMEVEELQRDVKRLEAKYGRKFSSLVTKIGNL
jgi:hypothetical protein